MKQHKRKYRDSTNLFSIIIKWTIARHFTIQIISHCGNIVVSITEVIFITINRTIMYRCRSSALTPNRYLQRTYMTRTGPFENKKERNSPKIQRHSKSFYYLSEYYRLLCIPYYSWLTKYTSWELYNIYYPSLHNATEVCINLKEWVVITVPSEIIEKETSYIYMENPNC